MNRIWTACARLRAVPVGDVVDRRTLEAHRAGQASVSAFLMALTARVAQAGRRWLVTLLLGACAATGPVAVTVGAATASSAGSFTVAGLPAPTLTTFAPNIAGQGTAVTLTGSNFQTAKETNKILFGTLHAPAVAGTSTALTTAVP